jgi:CheY-like chemotaxis protein
MLVDVLRHSGYAAVTAPSGERALRLLVQSNTIDLVVLDYEMPEMRGDLVAHEIRRRRPKLPIILFAGMPDDVHESVQHNVDAVVYKTDFGRLLTVIGRLTEVANLGS